LKNNKYIIFASAVIVVIVLSVSWVATSEYNQMAKVTVSGQASSASLYLGVTSLIGIQFIDTQTGTNTSYAFNFPLPTTQNSLGNYTVTLINHHTYNVTISYYGDYPLASNFMDQFSDYVGNFTVDAPAGQTQLIQNFGVP
jgi:hypothetical protein